MEPPHYKGQPIDSLETLAKLYNISLERLHVITSQSSTYYRAIAPIPKENGKVRQVYDVIWPLDKLQRQIVDITFRSVDFPSYLQGSLRAVNAIPRDYIEDAWLHAPCRTILRFDIEDFFPSIGYGLVFRIWCDFFCFPSAVAHTLAKITTHGGVVPQGASTSSYIANLVFWDKEPQLEAMLAQQGFIYTRYVDDINVSSKDELDNSAIAYVTAQVYGMMRSKGLKPNRKKWHVQTKANKKTIHNLNVSAGFPTKAVRDRSKIRAAVQECEVTARTGRSGEEYRALYRSTLGRVIEMQRLHANEARRLLERLDAIKPIL